MGFDSRQGLKNCFLFLHHFQGQGHGISRSRGILSRIISIFLHYEKEVREKGSYTSPFSFVTLMKQLQSKMFSSNADTLSRFFLSFRLRQNLCHNIQVAISFLCRTDRSWFLYEQLNLFCVVSEWRDFPSVNICQVFFKNFLVWLIELLSS